MLKWKAILATSFAVLLLGSGFVYVSSKTGISATELERALPSDFVRDASQGELIFHMGGCANCHAKSGAEQVLTGGEGLKTPFGTFYAPNITPDIETGIGSWSDADFVNAMHLGIRPQGGHYYPAFPYLSYRNVSISDVLHLKAYLDSFPSVRQAALPHHLSFPFNVRPALAFWKLVALRKKPLKMEAEESVSWNRGAYIVNGIGHCGVCHTPRNLLFAADPSRQFGGAKALKEGEKAAPRIAGISQDKTLNALSEWSGAINEKSSMYLVTLAYSNHVPVEDHLAIADYLASLEPAE